MFKRILIKGIKLPVKRIVSMAMCVLLALSAAALPVGCVKKENDAKKESGAASVLLSTVGASLQTKKKKFGKDFSKSTVNFMYDVFKNGLTEGENSLVSPLSVLIALAMTENGAEGETLEKMRSVISNGMDTETLNEYLALYLSSLPNSEYAKLNIANSVWFREAPEVFASGGKQLFTPNEAFLKKNADHYGADIFASPFDEGTVKAINGWVNEKTEGTIDEIIKEISSDSIMCLINALLFEAEWHEKYLDVSVSEGTFTSIGGEERKAQMMHAGDYNYIENADFTGFMRGYADPRFGFIALLPKEGEDLYECINRLTGEELVNMIENIEYRQVQSAIPKFAFDYEIDLKQTLMNMGMGIAFDPNAAQFGGVGTCEFGNIYIGKVLHKTHIEVDQRGTKAGAVTSVEMMCGSAFTTEEIKEVVLDRPFVFAIYDFEANIPVFIGTVTDIG
ncbi:MAG: serpin family protein [Clostridia bacterium]|nr:serpin family protein [Clostridia bacterium]